MFARRSRASVAIGVVSLFAGFGVIPIANTAGAQTSPVRKASKITYLLEKMRDDTVAAKRNGRSPVGLSNRLSRVASDGGIDVTIWLKDPFIGRYNGDLARLGVRVVKSVNGPPQRGNASYSAVRAIVPAEQLDAVAALEWVGAITPVDYGESDNHPTNPTNSEGVALHNADDVRTRGINGTGVNVGVISDGVTTISGSDLPTVTVLNAGSGDEGTAMLEIVHDMAPGASLLFDTQGGVPGHAAALANLVSNGANVITEDLAFDTEPAFQQGLLASTGDAIAAAGVSIHSSAGNLGQSHAARVLATGTGQRPENTATTSFTGCANTPDNVVAIAPSNDTTFDVTLGNASTFVLQWSEPRAIAPTVGQGGFTDLNLYVMDAGLTRCLGQSTAVQTNGTGDTMEVVTLPASLNGTAAKIVVDVQSTSNVAVPTIDLRWRRANAIDAATRTGSLNPDSNYLGAATSSAAVNASGGGLEAFSAAGPVALFITTQCPGGAPGPCANAGVAGPTTGTANGPAWAAADGVTVIGAGGFSTPFFGTSAAAPHAAGCDALLRDALNTPAASPATTNARLALTAVDIAPVGVDSVTGAGRLDCLAAVNTPPTANAGGPYTTNEGASVTLDGTGSSDPDSGDTLTYAWDLDNDTQFDDSTASKPPFALVGQDGVFTVRLQVTDTAGVAAVASSTVTVKNVAPVVSVLTTTAPKSENASLTVIGTVTDPGWLDPLTATIDWGDGAGAQALTGTLENTAPDATLTFSVNHVYGDDATFTVMVCAADDDTTGNCKSESVTITNTAPTAAIDKTGSSLIAGLATFLAPKGTPVAFTGRSLDPGSDDITQSWDWGDGTPSPDRVTTSFNNAPTNTADPDPSPTVNPRDVTDATAHAFVDACVYNVTFGSSDDDNGAAPNDNVVVIITGNASDRLGPGYWQTQYQPRPTAFSEAQRQCYLAIARQLSAVFSEARVLNTVKQAFDAMTLAKNGGSAQQKLDRQLLTNWLNFANGSVNLTTLIDTNGDSVPDTAFATVMANAEAVRLNPASTSAQLTAQTQILERVSVV